MLKLTIIVILIGIIWLFALATVIAMIHDLFRSIEKTIQKYSNSRPEYWTALQQLKRRVKLIVALWVVGIVYILGYTMVRWEHYHISTYHKIKTSAKHNILKVQKYKCVDIPLGMDYCQVVYEKTYDISHYLEDNEVNNDCWCQETAEHN